MMMSTATLPTLPETTPAAEVPTVAEIDRITAMSDLVLRNLLITQSYHLLSAALTRSLGTCANWCTHATWASKQAGQTIRREDFARVLEQQLAAAPGLSRALGDVVAAALPFGARVDPQGLRASVEKALFEASPLEKASEAVSRGNHKVFAEIGREFARFLETCAEGPFDSGTISRFTDTLRPGVPPHGQGYLRRAFTHLYEARFTQEPKARAELILLANLEIGFHEQTRLQPEIQEALNAAMPDPDELRGRLLATLFPHAGVLLRLRLRLPRAVRRVSPLDRALDRLFDEFRRVLRHMVTELLMRLGLPGGRVLRLGRDLAASFPLTLQTLTHPDLRELLARIDPTPDAMLGTGAEDWADLPERMHYIADLFRGFQEDRSLLGPPFNATQVAALRAGRMPSGRL
jgi:hypothetical protein